MRTHRRGTHFAFSAQRYCIAHRAEVKKAFFEVFYLGQRIILFRIKSSPPALFPHGYAHL